ncbi:MAG TPA: nucleoside-diphosphate sugar epimerase/dehydratase [Bacteroidia bacterium]|nr:MAG: polysaccharide biosynthesis protein CapD [Bacteroidetes bacterium OLB10]MBV6453668.1 UDP-N-acetyl-alpha-D-glucosamine C6 dehydratase [Bacteroidia bacterium]MBX3105149.1 polysaccharide biosynthesis protein [Bacteroidota bacterium]MCE7954435.1 polysaccharide biosynthesis protein [Bacteroidetes bacterium CHB6]OQB65840.1 MAG: UDP-N-acetyl-alpha-D-glucosamine C6 dehydratase [Bacteroidetes bacterium ADurb.Bin141]
MHLFNRTAPRWVVLIIDMVLCTFSVYLSYDLRFNFSIPETEVKMMPLAFGSLLTVRLISFLISRTYTGIIRYTSYKDSQRIFITLAGGTLLLFVINLIAFRIAGKYVAPYSILMIDFLISMLAMSAMRVIVKSAYMEWTHKTDNRTDVLIMGAGEEGLVVKHAIEQDAGINFRVLGFVDENPKLRKRKLEGKPVFHVDSDLEDLLRANQISSLIIADKEVNTKRINELIEICVKFNTKVQRAPSAGNWANGKLSFAQIQEVNIEDLLERDPINLDVKEIRNQLQGKLVLITGAAGSIGSEIARQVILYNPSKVVLLDIAESPLYELELFITENNPNAVCESVIADIRNADRMKRVFDYFRPDVVFHAAAYKHVPVMEVNPSEAILTNVKGTKILADLSVQYGVEKFVMISTDKAVNPTNVMGASKRIAEIYIQSLNKISDTQFITTRFGNVLGSAGSVIPRFKKQIEKGLPVTVTDENITRFFMTIPEACQLVLEACKMGHGGEIFIFDMGKPVKIAELARKMIRLSGLEPDKDIRIVYTGLRPGEKLYEELLNKQEDTLATHHSKILIAKVREYHFEEISREIDELTELFKTQDNIALVSKMKAIVPEYISNNSEFEKLDRRSI